MNLDKIKLHQAVGHIAPGEVDTRSIEDVLPSDLTNFTQCHFFAGIGVWSHALRGAGWLDSRPVWTGSCPCQPFSAAGKGLGFADERHLWPAFYHLIRECRPSVIFGEQVASKDGLAWLDIVHTDLEAAAYAVGAGDICAAGFGAPHIRQRLYWVADADHERCAGLDSLLRQGSGCEREPETIPETAGCGVDGGMGNAVQTRLPLRQSPELQRARGGHEGRTTEQSSISPDTAWSDCEWIDCLDGKARPTEPGTFPLAHGATSRVGRLRAYGNAIVAPQAKESVSAYLGGPVI